MVFPEVWNKRSGSTRLVTFWVIDILRCVVLPYSKRALNANANVCSWGILRNGKFLLLSISSCQTGLLLQSS